MSSQFSIRHTTIPTDFHSRWQPLVDSMAQVFNTRIAMVTRVHENELEILTASHSPVNPFKVGTKHPLDGNLYCESTLRRTDVLYVKDASRLSEWKNSSLKKNGLTSYLGLPLHWPTGELFGTISLIDSKPITSDYRKHSLLHTFRTMVQNELHLLIETEERKRYQRLLEGKMMELTEFSKELVRKERRIIELKNRLVSRDFEAQQSLAV
jgi:transcriptional regulator with GAF, ATPase, and Fis domain